MADIYLNQFKYEDTGIDWTIDWDLVEDFNLARMRTCYLIDMKVTDQDGKGVNPSSKMEKILHDEIWKKVKQRDEIWKEAKQMQAEYNDYLNI